MITLSLIPVFALFNWIRGRIGKRAYFFLAGGTLAALIRIFAYGDDLVMGTITCAIIWLGAWGWAAPGWGRGFLAFHDASWERVYKEAEIPLLDHIAAAIAYPYGDQGYNVRIARIHGMIWMALRGLFALPLFAMLGFLYGDWTIFAAGFGMAGMGPIYGAMRWVKPGYELHVGEALTGALLGGLIAYGIR